jgi:hypothetical protein
MRLFYFCNQFGGIFGHGAVLGTYIGTDLYGNAMSFLYGFAIQDGSTERTGE